MDKTNPLAFCGLTIRGLPLVHKGPSARPSVSVGCVRRRGERHGAGAKAPGEKFLVFHALRPTAVGALDERAEALHMALLCPGKTLWRARGISVPCFSLHKYRSLRSLPCAALLSLAKRLMQGWGEAPAWLAFPRELHGDGFAAPTHWTLPGQVSVLQTPAHHYPGS